MTTTTIPHEVLSEPNTGIRIGDWEITSNKNIILAFNDLEKKTEELGLPSMPDMYFSDNFIQFHNKESGFNLRFQPEDAIKGIFFFEVASADEWASKRASTQTIPKKEFDWTFTTSYKGTLSAPEGATFGNAEATTERINLEKLKTPDPILFFDDIVLYEDEFDDNGVGQLSVKVRVMPKSFYCLQRYWMRVDGVLFRINETRVYHEFGNDYLLREYTAKEVPFKDIKSKGLPVNDPNVLSTVLPVKTLITEKVFIKPTSS